MNKKYHSYIFDLKKRKFIGKFDEMYKNELKEGFDSWYQEDFRHLNRRIILNLLNLYNFDTIIDLGCGKGTMTHLLKKNNNQVIGVDISESAINTSIARYPDIQWICDDISDHQTLRSIYEKNIIKKVNVLTVIIDTLSYLKNWKKLIQMSASYSDYFLCGLYIPKKPIGYIKSFSELKNNLCKYYEPIQIIKLEILEQNIFFGKNKKENYARF